MDLSRLSTNDLKNAIWVYNNGMVPIGGLDVMQYRKELILRGENGRGYGEELE